MKTPEEMIGTINDVIGNLYDKHIFQRFPEYNIDDIVATVEPNEHQKPILEKYVKDTVYLQGNAQIEVNSDARAERGDSPGCLGTIAAIAIGGVIGHYVGSWFPEYYLEIAGMSVIGAIAVGAKILTDAFDVFDKSPHSVEDGMRTVHCFWHEPREKYGKQAIEELYGLENKPDKDELIQTPMNPVSQKMQKVFDEFKNIKYLNKAKYGL